MREPLDPKVQKKIVAAYERGDKIKDIQESLGVPRATIYYVLEKHGVTSNRIKRRSRLTGGDVELAQLYELIDSQNKVIEQQREVIAELQQQLKNGNTSTPEPA